jgi:hypothetical protein
VRKCSLFFQKGGYFFIVRRRQKSLGYISLRIWFSEPSIRRKALVLQGAKRLGLPKGGPRNSVFNSWWESALSIWGKGYSFFEKGGYFFIMNYSSKSGALGYISLRIWFSEPSIRRKALVLQGAKRLGPRKGFPRNNASNSWWASALSDLEKGRLFSQKTVFFLSVRIKGKSL